MAFFVLWIIILIAIITLALTLAYFFGKPVGNKVHKIKQGFQEDDEDNNEILSQERREN